MAGMSPRPPRVLLTTAVLAIALAMACATAPRPAAAAEPSTTNPMMTTTTTRPAAVATAAAWQLGPFVRPAGGVNPVVRPDPASVFDCPMRGRPVHWEAAHTFNPAAVVRNGKVVVLYRAEDASGAMAIGGHTSRLGMATSADGLHFTREPAPVFYPADDAQRADEWEGGCEDPRLITAPDGTYVLTYTQWNHKLPRLAVATSPDLHRWTKHGCAFADATRYAHESTKSGAILGRLVDGNLVATQVNGHYWMYWGEGDVKLATSDDLVRWTTVESSPGHPLAVLPRRKGHFDSDLAEGGPPAVLTDRGIVVLYNGKNAGGTKGDPAIGAGAYSVGQALFDPTEPAKLLDRPAAPCYGPAEPWERTGQYAAGTTFAEGLVRFHDKWFLYYGCADSLVGVAVAD